MRLLAVVEYDGTDFEGFQLQARRTALPRTVQGEIEAAIAACTGERVRVIGSGRTDAGVHARGQSAHFDSAARLATDPERFARALNARLPEDVKVRSLRQVDETLHARYSATRRRYCYRVLSSPESSPLQRRYVHHVRAALALEPMRQGARHLEGTHDFVAFAAQEGRGSTVRHVFRTDIWHTSDGNGSLFGIEVTASGFLRHMMRRVAGTLIRVGDGRLASGDVPAILASRDKALAGPTAPARGLTLEEVTY